MGQRFQELSSKRNIKLARGLKELCHKAENQTILALVDPSTLDEGVQPPHTLYSMCMMLGLDQYVQDSI